eukprot:TRINITY_DN1651_c0_g1_i5.p1 TRINITY_DN1651_c0_g1~~TRINITY_DN1651_c0_g1_i5.p1  ORF type:complete len:688 (-),score=96.14 TRINITY_DN1651_c0_g1_i5:1262-3325(-)
MLKFLKVLSVGIILALNVALIAGEDANIVYELSNSAFQRGSLDSALSLYWQARHADTQLMSTMFRADLAKESADVSAFVAELPRMGLPHPLILYDVGTRLLEASLTAAGISRLQQAVQQTDRFPVGWHRLAEAYAQAGNLGDAMISFQIAISQDALNATHRRSLMDVTQRQVVRLAQPRLIPRIVFVNGVRKQTGGPEALHQMHNMVNKIWPERSEYVGGIEAFSNEHSRFLSEVPWDHLAAGDIVVVPEEIPLPSLRLRDLKLRGVVLVMVYMAGDHDLSRVLHRDYFPACVSNFLRDVYGAPKQSVMFPPIGLQFLNDAQNWQQGHARRSKEALVLVDDDFALNFAIHDFPAEFVTLKGFTRSQMVELYQRAKVVVDLHTPGPERVVMEAVLFDVIPVVTSQENGRDEADFPFAQQWKPDRWNASQVRATIMTALESYQAVLPEFDEYRAFVRNLEPSFEQAVRNFYGDSLLFVITALTITQEQSVIPFILSAISRIPLASFEVLLQDVQSFQRTYAKSLHVLGLRGWLHRVRFAKVPVYALRLGVQSLITTVPTSVPQRFTCFCDARTLLNGDLMGALHALFDATPSISTRGLTNILPLCVDTNRYFSAVGGRLMQIQQRLLEKLFDDAELGTVPPSEVSQELYEALVQKAGHHTVTQTLDLQFIYFPSEDARAAVVQDCLNNL